MANKKLDEMDVAVHNATFRIDQQWFNLGSFYETRKEGAPEGTKKFTITFLEHLINKFKQLEALGGYNIPDGGIEALEQILRVMKKPRPSEDEKALIISMVKVLSFPRRNYR